MKFLIAIILTLSTITASYSAEIKNFTAHESKNTTSVGLCLWNQGGCDADKMEAKLQHKCYQKGYNSCETIKKTQTSEYRGADIFCGTKYVETCMVVVQGMIY